MILLQAIPALQDNYIWCLYDPSVRRAWCVDPGDAEPVIQFLNQQQLDLMGVLITHHHPDHTGGLPTLMKHWPHLIVIGPTHSPTTVKINTPVVHEQLINLKGLSLDFKVLAIPGHTLDHICFFNDTYLFCGDTLFSAGCGRLFEGTADQMYASLQRLAALPQHLQVCCAHEYTEANVAFALSIDPHNVRLQRYQVAVQRQRRQQQCTLPSTLELEQQINPFLRCDDPNLQQTIAHQTQQTITSARMAFSLLRKMKDHA
ncbi:MAG: hydroxyacylglutathione hydrolase [Shewanellaceae bacterium]|nr:hydroxyacylglutathione hydrolase [Shewanellaceae bacterium]